MDYISWWEEEKEDGLNDVKSMFNNIFKVKNFPSIYLPILFRFINNPQVKHWDIDIYEFSARKISEIEKQIGKEAMKSTLYSHLHLIVYSYQSLLDLEERMTLMNRFRATEETKTKMFSINIFNDLLNNAFAYVLDIFIEFQSIIEKSVLSRH